MGIDRSISPPSMRHARNCTSRRPTGARRLLFAIPVIVAALIVGPATTYARRGAVHHRAKKPASAGLVAAWGFGGGPGGPGATIADASGHRDVLTLVGATLIKHGKYGGAVRFTGHDSFATVPARRNLNLRSGMTLEAWVRPSRLTPGYATILAKTRSGGGFPYGLELIGGRPETYGVIGGRTIKVRAKVRLPRNRWSFLAGTYDGSTVRLFVGARLKAHLAVRGKFRTSTGPLQMGGDQVWGEFFTGSLDNARIFSKARSPRQLARDRRTAVPGGLIHAPLSTPPGSGGTAGGTTSTSGTSVGPIGPGASAGVGLPAPLGPPRYVSQSTAGSGDGSSCANAHSADWFNTRSSWGTAAGQIGPGDVVHLCGTISNGLRALGSGQNGNPITVYFEPGASISMPVCPYNGACLDTNGQSYLTIDGGGTGVIESTQNGTDLPQKSQALGVDARGCTGCTIEYLTVRNMYVHTSPTDTAANNVNGMIFSGSNFTIQDNTFHDDDWALSSDWGPSDTNTRIFGNDLYNNNHGFASTAGFSGGNIGPVLFYANHLHDYANWDTPSDTYHLDGIHCYTSSGGTGAAHYNGFYIFDNVFDGASGGPEMTGQIFIEGQTGTPCADSTSPIWIFNNVASYTTPNNDGLFSVCSGVPHELNNTLIGPTAKNGDDASMCTVSGADVRNNVLTTAGTLIWDVSDSFAAGSPDYNVYADGGSNAFECNSNYYAFSQFSRWQSCIGGDSHSRTTPNAELGADGSPQVGSPVIDAGTNLTGLCAGALTPLCSNIYGVPRLAAGPWNAGAF